MVYNFSVSATYNFGNDIHNFIVTSPAAGRAICHLLHLFKFFFQIRKTGVLMNCLFDVCIADLFAFANKLIFGTIHFSHLLFKIDTI